jgi:hypothetical protein
MASTLSTFFTHRWFRRANWLERVAAFSLSLALVAVAPVAGTLDAQTPAANPARPTVTNPATLPPVGYLQFEQGYLGSLASPETASQHGANQVTKLAVTTRLMVQVQTQPFAVSREAGTRQSTTASGDILAGAQAVLFLPRGTASAAAQPADAVQASGTAQHRTVSAPTVALGYLGRVHAGSTPDIDQGGYANSLVLLVSGDVGVFHYDINFLANEQTDSQPLVNTSTVHTVRRAQLAQTLSINRPLFSQQLQLSTELYHFTQPFVSSDDAGHPVRGGRLIDVLVALSYQLRPNLVFDSGFSHGFTATSTRWQSFAGFTYLLPHRLWRGKS